MVFLSPSALFGYLRMPHDKRRHACRRKRKEQLGIAFLGYLLYKEYLCRRLEPHAPTAGKSFALEKNAISRREKGVRSVFYANVMTDISQYFPITDPTWVFFIVLCIILLAPMIMNKLRIPHLIGMVLAGIAVGEYGFNILERDASFELFGKVGLYYIMFLAGLEMDMEGLRKHAKRMLLFGLLTFAVPFIMVYFAGLYVMDYSTQATILLCCILSSNTLIAYPIVCKYGVQRHHSVTLCVGASMLALLLVLVIVSAFGAYVAEGGTSRKFWILMIVRLALYCGGLAYVVPRFTRWFLRRYADAVVQFIYVLAVLFLCAALSTLVGLEGVFGAFFAGLLLNRYIPRVSPLMNRIEFTGNALFIPYFLIGVGMLINIRELFHGWHTAFIVFCMVFFGTIGKMIAAYLAAGIMRLKATSGHMMFGLTSAHAAGSIAIVMVGLQIVTEDGSFLVDADMLNGVVIMILFTCIISSAVTDYAARRIVLDDNVPTNDDKSTVDDEKMLIALRHGGNTDALVSLAILMRNPELNRGLIGLNVVFDDNNVAIHQARGRRLLEQAAKAASAADVRMQTQSRIVTNVASGMIHAFKESDASEIVMGLHKPRNDNDSFWGMFTENLFTELNRQIVIAAISRPLNTIRRIHVAVPSRAEFEPGFHRWIDRLARLAHNLDCRIVFHGRQDTIDLISTYISERHPATRTAFEAMNHWNELPGLMEDIAEDHLLVIITARRGTVSYKTAFDKLPSELRNHYSGDNLMIIFPDQYGEPLDAMSFTAPLKS